jgi:magnesium-transporting ATPase (P-type)
VDDPRPLNDRIYEVAFNSDRKFMEVVCQRGASHCTYVKGILEAILPNCDSYVGADGAQVHHPST